jgi:hypothetical protein
MKKIILVFVFLLLSSQILAQKGWELNIPKKSVVVLKISKSAFNFTKISVWSGKNTYSTLIEQDKDGSLFVNNDKEWKDSDWNLMADLTVEDVKKKKEKDFQGTEVTLKNATINIKLQFANSVTDIAKAFDDVTFKGYLNEYERSEYYQKEVVGKFLPRIFSGKLSKIPEKFKLTLLKATNYETKNFGGENYKDKFYFVVKDSPTFVMNSIKLSQPQRVSYVCNQQLLNYFKNIYKELNDVEEIEGIKVEYQIPFKNFVTGLDIGTDNLQIYATMENIRSFSEFDITGQQLLDKSVVIIDGNRANVNLTLQ